MKVIVISFADKGYSNPISVERICSSVESFRKYFTQIDEAYHHELSLAFDRDYQKNFNLSINEICNYLQYCLDENILTCVFGRFTTEDDDEFFKFFIQIRNIH